jgi:hypothetical protein
MTKLLDHALEVTRALPPTGGTILLALSFN